MLEIWIDGSVRDGNPGRAGISFYVEHDSVCVKKYATLLPLQMTNNEAEYEAVLASLYYLKSNNINNENCIIYTDSKLVYGQVVGGWRCNFSYLRCRLDAVLQLLKDLPFKVDILWINRNDNVVANELAQNITIKGGGNG